MRTFEWSAERVDMLARLWAEGATAQAIAERLGGVSRSAVMGKIFRLRLGRAAPAAAVARAARPPLRHGNSLLELTNSSCRWPHGDPGAPGFYFCGVPGADLARGMPYCADHARLAFGIVAAAGESNDAPEGKSDNAPASAGGLPPFSAAVPARAAVRRAAMQITSHGQARR